MKLHEIENEIAVLGSRLEDWAAEHDGDVTDFPFISEMEGLTIQRERKILSMGCLVKEFEAEAEALEKEAATLKERARIKRNASGRVKGILSVTLLPGEKLADERVEMTWRRSTAVEVDAEPEALPERFRRTKTVIEVDKAAIKDALKSGEAVEGARIVSRENLQIR